MCCLHQFKLSSSNVKFISHQILITSRVHHIPIKFHQFLISSFEFSCGLTDTQIQMDIWMPLKIILASHIIADMQLQPAGNKLQAPPVQQIIWHTTCTVDDKHYMYSRLQMLPVRQIIWNYLYSGWQALPVQQITSITCTVDDKHYLYSRLYGTTCTADDKHYLYSRLYGTTCTANDKHYLYSRLYGTTCTADDKHYLYSRSQALPAGLEKIMIFFKNQKNRIFLIFWFKSDFLRFLDSYKIIP